MTPDLSNGDPDRALRIWALQQAQSVLAGRRFAPTHGRPEAEEGVGPDVGEAMVAIARLFEAYVRGSVP